MFVWLCPRRGVIWDLLFGFTVNDTAYAVPRWALSYELVTLTVKAQPPSLDIDIGYNYEYCFYMDNIGLFCHY